MTIVKKEVITKLRKLKTLLNSLMGYLYKFAVDIKVLRVPCLNNKNNANVVVSLTSYGRRVENLIVYYTLISLLRQTQQPCRIILWLAKEEWNDETIPVKLKSLKEKGVEICYYKDIKSYKKLIPSIKKYPDAIIITFDDDTIYSSDTIEVLMEEHKRHRTDVICLEAKWPVFNNGIPFNYYNWEELTEDASGKYLFPVGAGGILYPPDSYHKDILKEEVFSECCPQADDIWFWFNCLRVGTNKIFIKKKKTNLSFDNIYQYFHKGSALAHTNRLNEQNDRQFRTLFNYYNYSIKNNNEDRIINTIL